MAQLTEKQLEDKLRFAGETIPSMTRRRDGHDYEARQMYLITITVEGRRPLLGRVVGNPEAEEGAAEAPHIELSPLGKAVEQDWMASATTTPKWRSSRCRSCPTIFIASSSSRSACHNTWVMSSKASRPALTRHTEDS